jgi:hypothetical protein
MIKSRELSEPTSCINKSQDDEMVFVLCARDPLAADLVRIWANQREVRGGKPEKVAEARAAADAMDTWRAAHAPTTGNPQPEVRRHSDEFPGDDDEAAFM